MNNKQKEEFLMSFRVLPNATDLVLYIMKQDYFKNIYSMTMYEWYDLRKNHPHLFLTDQD